MQQVIPYTITQQEQELEPANKINPLISKIFSCLCNHFFYEDGTKIKFKLNIRENILSDPFVEYLDGHALKKIGEIKKVVAPPQVCPDIAFLKDKKNLFGLEVKTFKSTSGGVNFNSTIPCGKTIIEMNGEEQIVPCYYLFVHLMEIEDEYEIGSLMMVDGDFINSDFDLYLEATGIRKKKIDVGSYGDGIDRQRPFFVFPNPMSIQGLRKQRSTLITKHVLRNANKLSKVAIIQKEKNGQAFYAYQEIRKLVGPFHDFSSRTEDTKPRNKFKIKL